MSRIDKAKKNIAPEIWKKLPEEAKTVLRQNGFVSMPMKTINYSDLFEDITLSDEIVVKC